MATSDPSQPPGNGPHGLAVLTPEVPDTDWAAVLAEHGRWLRAVVRSRLGEDRGIDEVMQDVSLAAVAQRAPVSDPARLGAWLYQVAVRQSLQYRRKHGRQRKFFGRYARDVAPTESAEVPGSPAADPLGWLLAEERDRLVREAVDRLPDDDRELIVLKYTENWTYRDLAQLTGQTESAIEARLHRIRRRLRTLLADA